MTEKRFIIIGDSNIEFIMQTQLLLPIYDNKKRLNLKTCCDLLNELHEENKKLKEENEYLCKKIKENEWHWNTIDEDRDVWRYKCKTLEEENEHYKSIFFELVETALTDKNCRKLYCEGILNIFDKANSLNQAKDMIKEHLK